MGRCVCGNEPELGHQWCNACITKGMLKSVDHGLEPVMYIVVNASLGMDKGKAAAQVAHSAVMASHEGSARDPKTWLEWYGGSHTKVCLKADEATLRDLIDKYPDTVSYTVDEGRTQIGRGSLTTVAFIPTPRALAPPELQSLKLY